MEYYRQFTTAILHLRERSIVLLTLSPLTLAGSLDLHALATPPAFNLSQNQTLQLFSCDPRDGGPGSLQKKGRPVKPATGPFITGRRGPVQTTAALWAAI